MDAFVVLDKAAYQKLTGMLPAGQTEKVQGYQGYLPTAEDQQKLETAKTAFDTFYAQNGKKSTDKWNFIKTVRGWINDQTPVDKRWLYNQILIYLFTIDTMK